MINIPKKSNIDPFFKSNLNHDPYLRHRHQVWISVIVLTSLTNRHVRSVYFSVKIRLIIDIKMLNTYLFLFQLLI